MSLLLSRHLIHMLFYLGFHLSCLLQLFILSKYYSGPSSSVPTLKKKICLCCVFKAQFYFKSMYGLLLLSTKECSLKPGQLPSYSNESQAQGDYDCLIYLTLQSPCGFQPINQQLFNFNMILKCWYKQQNPSYPTLTGPDYGQTTKKIGLQVVKKPFYKSYVFYTVLPSLSSPHKQALLSGLVYILQYTHYCTHSGITVCGNCS